MKVKTAAIIMCAISISICGCGQQEISGSGEDIAGEDIAEVESIEELESAIEPEEPNEDPYAIYMRFLDGEVPVYFKEADRFEGYDSTLSVEADTPYELWEICDMINTVKNGNISLDEFSDHISYARIDCGADGNVELAVKFHDLTDTISDEVTLVIKDVDGRLEVCYIMQPYYRETWELANAYGMVSYHIYAGPGVDGNFVGYIGADGVHHVVWDEYNDYTFYGYYNFPEDIPYEIPEDEMIVLRTYAFGMPDEDPDLKQYQVLASLNLTFTMADNNYNIEDSIIDLDGISQAVAEAMEMELYSFEEMQALAKAREAEIGLTDEIKNGPEVEWLPFTGTIATF